MADQQPPDDAGNEKNRMDIQEENELLKLKLSAQYGAEFSDPSPDLPAEVENDWLHYIKAFEEASQNPTYIKVRDKLGNPKFPPAERLVDTEIEVELNNLMELLALHDIHLDVMGEYEDRVIYKFITEELFEHEMEVIEVPGLVSNYLYEDFHPNPLLDARDGLHEIMRQLDKPTGAEFIMWRFHESGISDAHGDWVDYDEVKRRFEALQENIEALQIDEMGTGTVERLAEDEAKYTTHIRYRYKLRGQSNWLAFDTDCTVTVRPSEHAPMWCITAIHCPGFEL